MSAYSALILAHANLSLYYRLAETSGTDIIDAGPNVLNGTYDASVVTFGVTGALANDSNKAVTFDGTTNAARRADDNALDLGDGPFSIEFWVKRSAMQSVAQAVLIKGANAYDIRWSAGNRLSFFKNLVAGAMVSSSVVTDQNWHHVVVTKNGATSNIYVDGALDNAVPGTDKTLADTTGFLNIGHAGGGANRLPGSLDEIAIYKAVLSATEVAQHYNIGKGLIAPATETDSAQALDKDKSVTKTAATETDTAQALVYSKPIFKTLTPSTETDSAQAQNVDKAVTLPPASETDTAQSLSVTGTEITPATETDQAQALSYAKPIYKSLTPATETDAAEALTFSNAEAYSITPASETDAAQSLSVTHVHYRTITPAEESDAAQPLNIAGNIYRTLTPATETDEAQSLSVGVAQPPDAGGWVDIGRRVIRPKRPQYVLILPAEEHDQAVPLGFTKTPSRIQIEDDELLLLV